MFSIAFVLLRRDVAQDRGDRMDRLPVLADDLAEIPATSAIWSG